jgi:hypothetical protein
MATRGEKAAEKVMRKLVETCFYEVTSCKYVIPMMSIPALFRAGEETYRAAMALPLTAVEVKAMVTERLTNEVVKVAVKP